MINLSPEQKYAQKVAGFKVGTRVVYKDQANSDTLEAVIVNVIPDPSPRQQSHRYDVQADTRQGYSVMWEVSINQLDFSCYDSTVGNELLKEVSLDG